MFIIQNMITKNNVTNNTFNFIEDKNIKKTFKNYKQR